MTKRSLSELLDQLISRDAPSVEMVRDILDVGLVEVGGSPTTRYLEADRELDEWSRVELRLRFEEPKGLLVLRPARPSPWSRKDVSTLSSPPFDQPPALSPMPRLPPAGGDLLTYETGRRKVTLTIDAPTGELVSITVKWL